MMRDSKLIVAGCVAGFLGVYAGQAGAHALTRDKPAPVPVSACERALAANLTVAYRALTDYQHGRARAGRDLWLSETAALPVGCGR